MKKNTLVEWPEIALNESTYSKREKWRRTNRWQLSKRHTYKRNDVNGWMCVCECEWLGAYTST